MRLALLIAFVLAFDRVTSAQEQSTEPEPILETGELMLMVIKPAYDELRQAMSVAPVDRAAWAQLYQKAARLAEFENLILFRPNERSGRPEWKTLAGGARKASAALASAAMKGLANPTDTSFADLKKTFEDVPARCNACHRAMSREAPTIKPD